MQSEVTPLSAVGDTLCRAWDELSMRAMEPNPFAEPSIALSAARHLPGGADAVLLTVRRGSDLLLAMPLARRRWWRIPVPALTSVWHDYCFLGTPLVDGDDPVASIATAFRALRNDPSAPWLVADLLPAAGPVRAAWQGALDGDRRMRATSYDRRERAVLHRRPEGGYLDGRLSARRRKTLRRAARGLTAALGGEPEIVDRGGDPTAVEDFLRIEASGWKGRAGTALAADAAHAEFFRAACTALAERERLEMWSLQVADKPAAMLAAFRAGGTSFHFKIAYDEQAARFSPGMQLEVGVVERFHESGAQRIDSCTVPGGNVSELLYADRMPIVTDLVPLAGPVGTLTCRSAPTVRRAAERAKEFRRRRRAPLREPVERADG